MAELKKPSSSEMCPPGTHIVHGHQRVCKSGTTIWVETHVRRNRGKIKPGLLVENIHYLYWNAKKTYPSLPQIEGYRNGGEYDPVIQFWLEYWRDQGLKFPEDLDPLMVKALISLESRFDPKLKSKDSQSTASGLMQVTDQMIRVVGGHPNKKKWIECRDHLLHVTKADKLDPVVSIALGTRILSHKYSQIPKKYPKTAKSAITDYHTFDEAGEKYANEVFSRYEKAKKKK
jgi:soluble lytic murein transglycosylase-like protein